MTPESLFEAHYRSEVHEYMMGIASIGDLQLHTYDDAGDPRDDARDGFLHLEDVEPALRTSAHAYDNAILHFDTTTHPYR